MRSVKIKVQRDSRYCLEEHTGGQYIKLNIGEKVVPMDDKILNEITTEQLSTKAETSKRVLCI